MAEMKAEGKSPTTEENIRKPHPYKNLFGLDPVNLAGIPGGTQLLGHRTLFQFHSVHHGGSIECPDQRKTRK